MRTLDMFASRLHRLVNNPLCCFAKTEIKSDFKCVFTVILKKCQLRFSHNYTVLSLINYP